MSLSLGLEHSSSKVPTFIKGACSHMDNLSAMANAAKVKEESHLIGKNL